MLLLLATVLLLTTTAAATTLDELAQLKADEMYADRGKWHGSNLTPGVGMRRDPMTYAYYDWDSYVDDLYTVAHSEVDLIVSKCEVERALAQAAYDRGLLRKPRTCNRPCHEQVWRDHDTLGISAAKSVSDADHEWHWDKPVQTMNRAITLYEPGQSVNSAPPMPHSEASNTENPVPGADHERAWHTEVVHELTLACLGAVIGISLVNTVFAFWTGIYMYVYIRLVISGLFIMAAVSSGILQFNSAVGGFVMSVCITCGIVTGICTESQPVVYAARSPIRFI